MARSTDPGTQDRSPSDAASVPPFELDQHLFFWFTQVIVQRDLHLARELKPWGLRAPEWRVLASLSSRHRLSMSDLADHTGVERTTLTRVVDRMVRKGWVVRFSDASDLRVTRLASTGEGSHLFGQIWPGVRRLNEIAVSGLPEPMVPMLRWALREMRRSLDANLTVPAVGEFAESTGTRRD